MKAIFLRILPLIGILIMSGCGDSDDGHGGVVSSTPVLKGTFIDAPVQGLKYITATQSGFTNDKGEFNFKAGEQVEFLLGNLSFGSVNAGKLMSPYTMAGDTNLSSPSTKAINIAMVLQNFDLNRTNSSILDLSKLKNFDFSDVNLSAPTIEMESKIVTVSSAILAHADFGQSFLDNNTTLIDTTSAASTMQTYVEQTIEENSQFTTQYLNGKVFYTVIPTGDLQVPTLAKFAFTDSEINITVYMTESMVFSTAYIIQNGEIVTQGDNDDRYYDAKSILDDVIKITETKNGGVDVYSTKLFIDKASAEAYLKNLNFSEI